MKLLITSILVACTLMLNAQVENGCISIDFETIPGGTPVSGVELSDQYKDAFGLSFRLEGGGFPVLAQVGGNPAEAFGSAWGNDTPAPGVDIGQFFLTDDGQLSGLTSPPIILEFEIPIDSFAGCILDMDFEESFVIQALDFDGNVILEETIVAGDPGTGDGALTCWGFNLPGCEGSIYSIKYAGSRPASTGGAFGLGMDFFSFCYSGLQINTVTTPVTCNELGSINIFSTTNEVYEYSLDGVTYSLNGFFDQLDQGIQTIYVRDSDNCTATVDVNVELDYTELPDPIFVNADICDGESFSFNGVAYTDGGMYQQTLPAANGCDTLWNLTLNVLDNTSEMINAEICDGESFELNGESYTMGGTFQQILMNAANCDSIIDINLVVNPITSEDISVQLCDGETFTLNGETYDTEGFFTQELGNVFDCDSIINLEIQFIGVSRETVDAELCDGETFVLNGQSYTMGGNFQQMLMSAAGCDSIIDINLRVIPNTSEDISVQLCDGETFTLNGVTYDREGFFTQELENAFGCDSIIYLELQFEGVTRGTVDAEICDGEAFVLNGQSYTSGGSFQQMRTNGAGCDSIIDINIFILPNTEESISAEICDGDSFNLNGETYTDAGFFSQQLTNQYGCDSLLNIEIAVQPTIESCESVSIFEGDIFTLNGVSYNAEGTYEQLLQTADGCDSLVIIKLDVLPRPLVLVHYDLNNCAPGGSSYSELTPSYDEALECGEVTASILNRPSGMPHSCTPGENGSGMCVSSDPSCTYENDSPHRLVFDVFINPTSDPISISGFNFFEKAPVNFEFNNGRTGPNNYPTYYAIKIIKNGSIVFTNEDVITNREWTLQTYNFSSMTPFVFDEPGILTFEFLAYCPIGITSTVSAWDIDELSLFGSCQADALRIEGNVMTSKVEPLAEVSIAVLELDAWEHYMTDDNGDFAFDTRYDQSSVLIEPNKDDDPLNGVSTLDVIKIQRHILGAESFSAFSDLVAADINKDQKITAIDLIELRKLILGIYDVFPENKSWRFLGAHKSYATLSDVDDQMLISALDEEINLEAIKVGDVDQSHTTNAHNTKVDSRSSSSFKLILKEYINSEGTMSIGFFASEDFNLAGFQATLNVGDRDNLQLVPQQLSITQKNYFHEKDELRMSWSSQNQEVRQGDLLFELLYDESGETSPIYLDINSSNEIYQAIGLNARSLTIEYDNHSQVNDDILHMHIHPNPFKNLSRIQIVSKERLSTQYELIDAAGKLIRSSSIILESGYNEIDLKRTEFPQPGIYFIRMLQNETVLVKRIVVL